MTIIIALVAFTLIFFVIRKHLGPAHLAMLAGLSVYEMFGVDCTNWLSSQLNTSTELMGHALYLVLVAVFPLILYLHSARGGLHGILRIAESVMMAILLTALISEPLAYFFPFDDLAHQISDFVISIEGPILVAGIVTAYLDILFLRNR